MCQVKSGEAVYAGGDLRIYHLPGEDSHNAIREHFHIRDGLGAAASRHTPIECIPVRGLFDIEDYDFVFDAGRPDWWEEWMTERAKHELFAAWMAEWDGKTLVRKGYADLRSLTEIPAGVTLRIGGYADLSSLTTIPAGVTLRIGGDANLISLTTIPAGVTLRIGGDANLISLTTIPAGVTLRIGGCANLSSLTTIPAGVTLRIGGGANLSSLTTIPAGVKITIGGEVFDGTRWRKEATFIARVRRAGRR